MSGTATELEPTASTPRADGPAAAATASGPTLRSTLRRARGPLLALAALVAVGVLLAVLSAAGPAGRLDPDAYDPSGSRAVAELLRDRGVAVERVGTVDEVAELDAPGTVVVVPFPQALAPEELQRLGDLQGRLVVVSPGDEALDDLGLGVITGAPVDVERRQPACELEVAVRAGEVPIGGRTYSPAAGSGAVGCYAASGRATLLQVPAERVTLLGSGDVLTNEELDEGGSAALALGVLGAGERVAWLMPRPGRPEAQGAQRPLRELVPDAVTFAVVQLFVAAALLALWRARRLGRVVEEPLPVVVRAAEAVEGRSRLYRAAGARDRAGEALRAGTRDRLARRLGLPPTADRPSLVSTAAARLGHDPARLDALLYGAAPADDDALVRLAEALTDLERRLQ